MKYRKGPYRGKKGRRAFSRARRAIQKKIRMRGYFYGL